MLIDLHCHSTNSDGTWTVEEILRKANEKGIKILSITDHDNLKGSVEAFQLNSSNNLFEGILIAGMEISTKVLGQKVHLLAFFPDIQTAQHPDLISVLDKIQNSRYYRMKKMIERANQFGFEVTFEEVLKEASGDNNEQPTDVISRPHLGRVLVKKGYVQDLKEAFDNYLADGKPLAVERFTLKFSEWIDLIHRIGGIIIWAHPLHARKDMSALKEVTGYLRKYGIDGFELYYDYTQKYKISPDFEKEGSTFLWEIAKRNKDLVITAGGDFHGDVGVLGMEIPLEHVQKFFEKVGIQVQILPKS